MKKHKIIVDKYLQKVRKKPQNCCCQTCKKKIEFCSKKNWLRWNLYIILHCVPPFISADVCGDDSPSNVHQGSRLGFNGDQLNRQDCNRASVASGSAVVSGNAGDLRRREVVLAKISLYMVFVFLICHSVKIVPNIYEMVQTYLEVCI